MVLGPFGAGRNSNSMKPALTFKSTHETLHRRIDNTDLRLWIPYSRATGILGADGEWWEPVESGGHAGRLWLRLLQRWCDQILCNFL